MKTKTLISKLAKRFPKRLAKRNHDYVGLMAGKLKEDVQTILLCLDFDEEVYEIAKAKRPDLIISHHPFIFGSKVKVLKTDEEKRVLYEKINELDIPVYSMHTNFDEGNGGMNDALSAALGLKNVFAPELEPMMRCGYLNKPMSITDFVGYAKRQLNVSYGLLVNSGTKTIHSVGIIGGGGSHDWRIAKDAGMDIYISGDAPHHVRRDIVRAHYNYLDLPHEIEKIFMKTMEELLHQYDSTLKVIIVDHEQLPTVI